MSEGPHVSTIKKRYERSKYEAEVAAKRAVYILVNEHFKATSNEVFTSAIAFYKNRRERNGPMPPTIKNRRERRICEAASTEARAVYN